MKKARSNCSHGYSQLGQSTSIDEQQDECDVAAFIEMCSPQSLMFCLQVFHQVLDVPDMHSMWKGNVVRTEM